MHINQAGMGGESEEERRKKQKETLGRLKRFAQNCKTAIKSKRKSLTPVSIRPSKGKPPILICL